MEESKLYDGEVSLFFDQKKHQYTLDGEVLPTSTTVTGLLDKPALRYWYVNKAIDRIKSLLEPGVPYDEVQLESLLKKAQYGGADARDEAASIGRLAHDWIENYVKRQIGTGGRKRDDLPLHTGARNSCEAFFAWEDATAPDYIFSERRMVSRKHRFAGTLDIACLLPKTKKDYTPTVVDIKTGSGVYPEYWLQVASYALMLAEERPEGWDYSLAKTQRMIVHCPQKGGGYKAHTTKSSIKKDAETFLALVKVWYWKNGQ